MLKKYLKEGESVKFKVVGRDAKTGKIKLSRKVLLKSQRVMLNHLNVLKEAIVVTDVTEEIGEIVVVEGMKEEKEEKNLTLNFRLKPLTLRLILELTK